MKNIINRITQDPIIHLGPEPSVPLTPSLIEKIKATSKAHPFEAMVGVTRVEPNVPPVFLFLGSTNIEEGTVTMHLLKDRSKDKSGSFEFKPDWENMTLGDKSP